MDLTICIPCFNDAKNVDKLLKSIYKSDTEGLEFEVLVCDGKSDDDIKKVVLSWESKIPVRLISTSYGASASVNLNVGAACAKGVIFCRIDSHCLVTSHFIKSGLREFTSRSKDFAALGPSVEVIASNDGPISKTISKLYMSPFLFGPSKYKRSVFYERYSGEVGNIYLGFYLTEDVERLRFSENIKRKQDIEFLSRLKAEKGIGFYNSSEVVIKYILKQDGLFPLMGRCFRQGQLLSESISSSRLVHCLPLIFAILYLVLIIADMLYVPTLGIYLALSFIFGALECRTVFGALFALILFPCVHLSYVGGNIVGIIQRIIVSKR